MAVYGIGRQLRLAPGPALLGAGAFALLPQPVMQSSSAHNDLAVASFVATSLLFLLRAAEGPRPTAELALAGAALGLALGTKPTAVLALPGLGLAFLLPFRRRLTAGGCCHLGRSVLVGLLLGGLAAVLLGSYVYAQNWYLYGSPTGSPLMRLPFSRMTPEGFVANLTRTLYAFAFADLSGPLAHPLARPVADSLVGAIAAGGEWLFGALGIPRIVAGLDLADWPPFTFPRRPRVQEYFSGSGPVGGLIVALAFGVLAWPRQVLPRGRIVALAAVSYLLAMSLTLPWSPFGAGRFLIIAWAIAAPLLGLLAGPTGSARTVPALLLVAWSAATGVYTACFNEMKPVARLTGQDRAGLLAFPWPEAPPFLRELDRTLGPATAVGVYGAPDLGGQAEHWDYPLFGPRFERTVVPLVDPEYAARIGLRRPLAWSNERLIETFRPTYIAVEGPRTGAEALPTIIPGRCIEVQLEHGKPRVRWELWRCDHLASEG